MKLTFDDVLIEPAFNTINSRKDVDISTKLMNLKLDIPVISSNMDTVTGPKMANTMESLGGIGCMHRFMDIETQKELMTDVTKKTIISVGISDYELERAKAMYEMGFKRFCIDVAHGASLGVCKMLDSIHETFKDDDVYVMVGNFATGKSFLEFLENCEFLPDAVKVGIGPGSACTTRIKTGCGYPQLSAIMDVHRSILSKDIDKIHVVADGGMRTPGDIAKAIAAGADAVMLGGMLAGTDETPGDFELVRRGNGVEEVKKYRGSASKESYEDQGKDESWRTAEGVSFEVSAKGAVSHVLQDIEGGLRSAFTYVGTKNMYDFRTRSKFIRISTSTILENSAHGGD